MTGSGPQSKVMMPPWATASMNASEVQLAGVPVPTTVVGLDTSSRPAPDGMAHGARTFDQVNSCPSSKPSWKIDSPAAPPRFNTARSVNAATFLIEAPPSSVRKITLYSAGTAMQYAFG